MLSRTKLTEQGENKILNLKMYETIVIDKMSNKIIQEILRKYINSFASRGFSGVSSGQKQKIQKADTRASKSIIYWKLYIFDNLIINIEKNNESVVNISHSVSVVAWYPPAYFLISWNPT